MTPPVPLLDLLTEMVAAERWAAGLFRRLSRSPLLVPSERRWAAKIVRDEAGHARVEAAWLERYGGAAPGIRGTYLATGRQQLTPRAAPPEPEFTITAVAWLWHGEREVAKFLPRWARGLEADVPELVRYLRVIVAEEIDHLRFHRTVLRRLEVERPDLAARLQGQRGELRITWPKIPGLADVPAG